MSYQHYCDNLNCILPDIRKYDPNDTLRSLSASRLAEVTAYNTPTHTSSKGKLSLAETRMQNLKALARTVSEEQRKQELVAQRSILLQAKKSAKVKAVQAKPVKPYDQRLEEAKRRRIERNKTSESVMYRKRSNLILDISAEVKVKEIKLLDTTISDLSKSVLDDADLEETAVVEKRIQDIQAKFARSEFLRNQALFETQARAAKSRIMKRDQMQACLSDTSFDSYTLAVKLITKQQEAAKRRMSLKKDTKRSGKKLKVADALIKKDQEQEHKVKQIEERQRLAERVVSMKKQAAMKDLDQRHEANRQKDMMNNEKQSREFSVRRERRIQILTRHIDKAKQVEELISRRQIQATGARDYRIQSMIEKEKFKEIQTRIIQSPHSKLALTILKEFA